MKKVYTIEGLCCPNCAAKAERAIAALEGVNSCTLSFFSKKLTVDVEEEHLERLFPAMEKEIRKVDMDAELKG